MTHHRIIKQEDLHQHYAELGKQIADFSVNQTEATEAEEKLLSKESWGCVTQEGFWKLPVPKQYGGVGLNWHDYIIAVEGLISTYSNLEFISALVTQISTIYLVLKYSIDGEKKSRLQPLMQGDNPNLNKPEDISKFLSVKSSNNDQIYYDFIDCKRVLYGILAMGCINSVWKNHKEASSHPDRESYSITRKHREELEKNILNVRDILLSRLIDAL